MEKINNYAKMLINKSEASKAAVRRSRFGQLSVHEPDLYRKDMDKIEEERAVEHSEEERKKFINKQNSLKPIGIVREIVGEQRVEKYIPKYYKTKDWLSRSRALIEKAGKKCCKCGYEGRGLTMHHLTYAYQTHTEPEEALECLCKDCHHLKHEINRIIFNHSSMHLDTISMFRVSKVKFEKITTALKKYAPWMLKDGENSEHKLKFKLWDFLNQDALCKIREEIDSYIDEKRGKAY